MNRGNVKKMLSKLEAIRKANDACFELLGPEAGEDGATEELRHAISMINAAMHDARIQLSVEVSS
jgi:hypothetical protein